MVTFYKIDSNGGKGVPVLYLDTLKVSTIEQTAENVSARGGKGNPELVIWDYNKEITVTLEDALYSAKSMAIMFGGDKTAAATNSTGVSIYKSYNWVAGSTDTALPATPTIMVAGTSVTLHVTGALDVASGTAMSMSDTVTPGSNYVLTGYIDMGSKQAYVIDIGPDTFPGEYYIVGDTFARSSINGEDDLFQFIIPRAKVQSEVTLTMEAEGDPSTFNLNIRVLRPANGEMMKLIQYKLG